jgi:hypothetical protein
MGRYTRYILSSVGALVAGAALLFALNAIGLTSYRFWAPKQEAARREVFEHSPAFIRGKQQHLLRLYGEWHRADPAHATALCSIARQEAVSLDRALFNEPLSSWECLK